MTRLTRAARRALSAAPWDVLDALRLTGAMLGVFLFFNALLWIVAPTESLLFIFWSGSSGVPALVRFAMALSTGIALCLLWRASEPRQGHLLSLGLVPAVLWSLADAVSVWKAGLFEGAVDLDGVAWVPTSLVLAVAIAAPGLAARKRLREAEEVRESGLALRLGTLALASVLMAGLMLHHISAVGATDYQRDAETGVVFGARAYKNGNPSPLLYDRIMTGVRLYKAGRVKRLLMTGGMSEGVSEPEVMKRVAVAQGVAPGDIILDEKGDNTAASVRNMAAMDKQRPLGRLLIISNDHHLSRIRLACHRLSLTCYTVPATMRQMPAREPYYRAREVAGFVHYALTFR